MSTILRGGTLIDGTGADPVPNTSVVVEADRIASVGRKDADGASDAATIDVDGLTILPGLIDSHVHLLADGPNLLRGLMTPPSLALFRSIRNCRATLEAGFTSVRDAAGAPKGLKLAVEEDLFPGPRLKVSITALSQTGGHGDATMPSTCCLSINWPDIPPSVVDGVEPMRQRVREVLRAGADWIKVCSTGGVLSSADLPSSSQFTVEELEAAVEEGRAHGGIEVMAHAQGTQGIKNAINAGCRSVEHGIWLDDEAIEMMKASAVYLVPTLVAPLQVIRQAEHNPGTLPPVMLEKARAVVEDHRRSFTRAVEAGVKVAMGTDSGVGPHGENAEELSLMVRAGMTPMQAIVAATQSGARLLKVDRDLGSVEAGKLADIVVVDGDPLTDISVLQNRDRVVLVVKGGRVVKNLIPERVPCQVGMG